MSSRLLLILQLLLRCKWVGMYHKSVLTAAVLQYLAPRDGGIYVDATFGGGGHTRAILQAAPKAHVIAFDWDTVAIETNGPALQEEFGDRLTLIWGNFAHIGRLLARHGIQQIDGLLADVGTSQFQIKHKEGFSFATDTPLDMRMSPSHQLHTAADIVNAASQAELTKIFAEFGEERHARGIATEIVARRKEKRFTSTLDLVDAVMAVTGPYRPGKIHPATKVFQALRIVVNHELDNITSLLKGAVQLMAPEGRLVLIAFHSLEDRLVKHFLLDKVYHNSVGKELEILTAGAVMASPEELAENPSSRSARLRAAIVRVKK